MAPCGRGGRRGRGAFALADADGRAAAGARTRDDRRPRRPGTSATGRRASTACADRASCGCAHARDDPLVAGRTHERYDQYHRGVRVFGADVAEQLRGGQVVSVFGNVYEGIDVDTSPAIDADRAREIIEARAGVRDWAHAGARHPAAGERATRSRGACAPPPAATSASTSSTRATAASRSSSAICKTQSAVGRGQGVLGDTKKISVSPSGGQFVTTDRLRPPAINTYDMRGDYMRTLHYLNGVIQLTANDLGVRRRQQLDRQRDGRRARLCGLDLRLLLQAVQPPWARQRRSSIVSHRPSGETAGRLQLFEQFPISITNAFYVGDGIDGLSAWDCRQASLSVDRPRFLSGALDIVAHELTHGVTDYSSGLIYQNESGALNESFSDIMGTSVEFYFQQPGSGNLRADYLIGEDVVRPGGIRSMADPQAYGDPDHYSRRFTGTADNGGVHINSGIANQAFYLAIEGGTNRTSGLSVQGVGRGEPRADRARVLSRVHADAAGERDVRRRACGDHPGRAGPVRRQQRRRTRGHASLDCGRCQLRTRVLSVALTLAVAAVRRRPRPWSERVHISVNGAFQTTTNDFSDRFEFERYLETGSTEVDYPVQGGFIFDAGAGYRLWKNLAVGRRRLVLHARRRRRARRRASRTRSFSTSREKSRATRPA